MRKVLRAFAVATQGFVQSAPSTVENGLPIDTLGEALVSVLHTMPERAATQILESRAGRYYEANARFDAIANAITKSRGPVLPKPNAAVALGVVTQNVSIEARRGWLTLISLGAVDQTSAPHQENATAAQPQRAKSVTVSQALGAAPRAAGTDSDPDQEYESEAQEKAYLLRLQLPTDPDAVHAALDLKKRLNSMFDKTHYEVLNIPASASKDTIRNAYFELAKSYHMDRFSNVALGEYRAVAEEVYRKISEASRILSDDDERSNYDVFLDRKSKGLPTDVNVILEADNLFQRAKMKVERGQGAGAFEDLKRAVELNNVDLDYQAYYAYSMY
ncbi:MAG: DnaJ domain-containing protein, partial [Myxococcota bacterium]